MADADEDRDRGLRDPFGREHIEVPEAEMRKTAPQLVLADRVKRTLNDVGQRLTYGR